MFGRRKDDEDPFAALGESGTFHSEPTKIPSTTNVSPSKSSRRRRSSGPSFRWMAWFAVPISIAVIVAVAGSAFSTSTTTSSVAPGAQAGPTSTALSTVSATSIPPSTRTRTGAITTHRAPTSYLTTVGMRAALAQLRHMAAGASPIELRINSNSFDAIVQFPNHGVKLINITPTGTFSATAGATGEKPIPFAKINAAVPGRIVAEMRHHFHVPLKRINYLVAFWFPGYIPEWQVFVKGPGQPAYLATLSGAQLHRSQ